MTWWLILVVAVGAIALLSASLAAALLLGGRREEARALLGFVPDCIVLLRRLSADARVPRRQKLLLLALVGYLASPFDLIPDFIPVVGHLDDAIVVALVLRRVVRAGGTALLQEHWPGPRSSLELVLRLVSSAP